MGAQAQVDADRVDGWIEFVGFGEGLGQLQPSGKGLSTGGYTQADYNTREKSISMTHFLLISRTGEVTDPAVQWLLRHRDDRPVTLPDRIASPHQVVRL